MLHKIRLIAFDLDDTLWPCMPVIEAAEQQLYDWLGQYYPRITDNHSPESMVEERKTFTQRDPLFGIDLSLMRREFLRYIADRHGYHGPTVSAEGFEVFFNARQQVTFYDDVDDALDWLAERYQLGAISNGNASVQHVGLGEFFKHSPSASDVQTAKPDPKIFSHFVQQSGYQADEILYVGDHPLNDVVAPLAAGYQAVWLNREGSEWPQQFDPPEHEIQDLSQLVGLLDGVIKGQEPL